MTARFSGSPAAPPHPASDARRRAENQAGGRHARGRAMGRRQAGQAGPVSRENGQFLSSLEGLRAIASLGIIGTHAVFQSGVDQRTPWGAVLHRFDFFVAVFFVLSGFLLWRRHSRDLQPRRYYRRRIARIVPAYLVCVAVVLLVFPMKATWGPVLATLTMTQLLVPDGLLPGLSHLWSICVEMSFYLVLPACVVLLRPVRSVLGRILCLGALGLLGLGWAWTPLVVASPSETLPNLQILPMSYALWFALGMIAAELEPMPLPRWVEKLFDARPLWWVLALSMAWLAGQEWFGPLGLGHPTPAEFTRRMLAGAVFGAAIVWPYALRPRSRWMGSAVMRALGRWGYGIFLWHMPILLFVYPLLGIPSFTGSLLHAVVVWVVTALLTVPVAAASYVFVEEPARSRSYAAATGG